MAALLMLSSGVHKCRQSSKGDSHLLPLALAITIVCTGKLSLLYEDRSLSERSLYNNDSFPVMFGTKARRCQQPCGWLGNEKAGHQ